MEIDCFSLELYQQIVADFSKSITISIKAENWIFSGRINFVRIQICGNETYFDWAFVSNLRLLREQFRPFTRRGAIYWEIVENTIRTSGFEQEDTEAIVDEVKSLIYGHIQ